MSQHEQLECVARFPIWNMDTITEKGTGKKNLEAAQIERRGTNTD